MTPAEVLEKEIEAFTGLIEEINDLGAEIPEFSPGHESSAQESWSRGPRQLAVETSRQAKRRRRAEV